jgi:predicted dienelactone hydrolase
VRNSISICLGFLVYLTFQYPLQAAEQVNLTLRDKKLASISVKNLSEFVKTGELPTELQILSKSADPETLKLFRNTLQLRIRSEIYIIGFIAYAPWSSRVLTHFSAILHSPNSDSIDNRISTLKQAIVSISREKESWTIADFIAAFPSQEVNLDIDELLKIKSVTSIIYRNNSVFQAISERATIAEKSLKNFNPANLPNLTQKGKYSVRREFFYLSVLPKLIDKLPKNRLSKAFLQYLADIPQKTTNLIIFLPEKIEVPVPIVVFSTGLGGTESNKPQDELAEHLASYGYAVVTFEPIGSQLTTSSLITDFKFNPLIGYTEFVARAHEISTILDGLEQLTASDPAWADRIDTKQVAVIGYSQGGSSALSLAGADIKASQLQKECSRSSLMPNMSWYLQCEMRLWATQNYDLRDERVKAAISVSPMTSALFSSESFKSIKIPLFLVTSSQDTTTPPVIEQIIPFTQLDNAHKYLLAINPGNHYSTGGNPATNPLGLGRDDLLKLPENQNTARQFYIALTIAFLQVHLRQDSSYEPYLTSAYARYLSRNVPIKIELIQSLSAKDLTPP